MLMPSEDTADETILPTTTYRQQKETTYLYRVGLIQACCTVCTSSLFSRKFSSDIDLAQSRPWFIFRITCAESCSFDCPVMQCHGNQAPATKLSEAADVATAEVMFLPTPEVGFLEQLFVLATSYKNTLPHASGTLKAKPPPC